MGAGVQAGSAADALLLVYEVWGVDKISADQKEHNKIDDFRLIEGFSVMKVVVNRNGVENLQNDDNTFLVDLGPKELYTGDNSAESTPWRDVAYFVKNYLTN